MIKPAEIKTYSTDPLGYYAILGVNCNADEGELKLKYREQAKKWHPDHNKNPEAIEVFQKLSVAYDVLSDEHKRLTYDLAAIAHPEKNFPDIFALKVFTNQRGEQDISLRSFNLWQLRGKIIKYNLYQEAFICNFSEAEKKILKTSFLNCLLGWWSLAAVFKNFKILRANYRDVNANKRDNLCLLIHNALAYEQEKNYSYARSSTEQAWEYADVHTKSLLENFLQNLPSVKQISLKKWNYSYLRQLQLVFPILLLVMIIFSLASSRVYKLNFLPKDNKINYYQEVKHWRGEGGVDDVIVAKILDIRTDLADVKMLYHLKKGLTTKVMYGPSDDFDVITTLEDEATVRVTGISPDKVWMRIMLDSGDMGFVHAEQLVNGIGAPIPQDSKIYKQNLE